MPDFASECSLEGQVSLKDLIGERNSMNLGDFLVIVYSLGCISLLLPRMPKVARRYAIQRKCNLN